MARTFACVKARENSPSQKLGTGWQVSVSGKNRACEVGDLPHCLPLPVHGYGTSILQGRTAVSSNLLHFKSCLREWDLHLVRRY